METEKITVGQKIKELLEQRDMKPKELASISGVSKALISMLITGKRQGITAYTAKKLSNAFGVSPGHFIDNYVKGPSDFLPHMNAELRDFVTMPSNLPWIVTIYKAQKNGLPLKKIDKIIEVVADSCEE